MQIYQENFNKSSDQIEQSQLQMLPRLGLEDGSSVQEVLQDQLDQTQQSHLWRHQRAELHFHLRVYTKLFEQHKKVDFTPNSSELKDIIDTVIDKMQQLTRISPDSSNISRKAF